MILDTGIFANIIVNGAELKYPADWLSFGVQDSIHTFYPKLNVSIEDKEGVFAEYLMTAPGNIIKFELGFDDDPLNVIENEFIIDWDMLQERGESSVGLGGPTDIFFLHAYANKQEVGTGAYEGPASKVVKSVIANQRFNSVNVEDTTEPSIWYQGGRSQASFLKEILATNAVTPIADGTPIFCFIDNHNNFNFISYKSMVLQSVFSYVFWPNSTEQGSFANKIIQVSRWTDSFQEYQRANQHAFYTINDQGLVDNERLSVEDYLRPNSKEYSTVTNQRGAQPSTYSLNFYSEEGSESEVAEKAEVMKKTLFRERFMVLVPFNPKIVSGKTGTFDFYLPTEDNDTYSERFSGNYLIEMAEHIWDGKSKSISTKMLISRKYAEVPSTYTLRDLLPS